MNDGLRREPVLRSAREDLGEARREVRERAGDVDRAAPGTDGAACTLELVRDPAPGLRRCDCDGNADRRGCPPNEPGWSAVRAEIREAPPEHAVERQRHVARAFCKLPR